MNRFLILAFLAAALLTPVPAANAASAPASRASETHHAAHRSGAHRATALKRTAGDSRNAVSTAVAVAERFWGATPCGGQIKVVANSSLAPGLKSGTDAWVTFNSSLGADNLAAPASSYTSCTISLAHWQWSTWRDMESDWGMFCLTVTHEMGHLLGHKHTLTPGSVMNPVFTSSTSVPAACHATWLSGWRPAGAR